MEFDKLKAQMDAIPIPEGLSERSRLGIARAAVEMQEASGLAGTMSERIQRGERRPSRRRLAVVASVLGIAVVVAALANHDRVWAAIHRALQFVPGIGMVKEEDQASVRYVLKEPIEVTVNHSDLVITGFVSDSEMTYMTVYSNKSMGTDNVILTNGQGKSYTLRSAITTYSPGDYSASFWYDGKLEANEDMTLSLGTEKLQVPIHLTKADAVTSYAELGPTVERNGLSVTAIADRIGDRMRVSLVAPPQEDYVISDYGISGSRSGDETRQLQIVDNHGEKPEISSYMGIVAPLSELYIPVTEGRHYTLTLPEIHVTYKDELKIKLPTTDQPNYNRTIELAGFPITITRIETIPENGGIRIYTDFHYDANAPVSLLDFTLDRLGGMSKLDERTGATEYMEFVPEKKGDTVTLKLVRPNAVIRGPWTFNLDAGNRE